MRENFHCDFQQKPCCSKRTRNTGITGTKTHRILVDCFEPHNQKSSRSSVCASIGAK
jgi:hypothetical protein